MANKERIESRSAPAELAPLSPRSIVLSVLLGTHPPRMPVGRILEFTSLFGIPDGTVRTALSRLVAAGDLVNDDGTYRLAPRLVERQAQQDAGRHEPPADWDGTWWTVAVVADRRTMTDRRTFRTRAIGSRLGELRPDLWLRPANIDVATDLADAFVTRGPVVAGDQRRLVEQLWDLRGLTTRAEQHRRHLDATAARLDRRDHPALADAFVTLAGAQQYLRVEPQLPAELALSTTAAELRTRYAEVVEQFQARLAEFFAERSAERVSTAAR